MRSQIMRQIQAKRPLRSLSALFICVAVTVNAQPPLPTNAVFRPTFLGQTNTTRHIEDFDAGTSFVANQSGIKTTMLTCHHLFGPGGGIVYQLSSSDIVDQYRAVSAQSYQDTNKIFVTGEYIKVPGAQALNRAGCNRDLAVFDVPVLPSWVTPLTVSPIPAKLGEKGSVNENDMF